jgi:hypothetical protein
MAVGDRIEAAGVDCAFHFGGKSIIKPQIANFKSLRHPFAEVSATTEDNCPA